MISYFIKLGLPSAVSQSQEEKLGADLDNQPGTALLLKRFSYTETMFSSITCFDVLVHLTAEIAYKITINIVPVSMWK